MNKETKNKVIGYSSLTVFIVIASLYWFSLIVMHYIVGFVSLIALFIAAIILLVEEIRIEKKQLISLIISMTTIVAVIITHYIVSKNPFSYYYEEIDDGVKITGHRYRIANNYGDFSIEIPLEINGKKVKVIGKRAFAGSQNAFRVIISDNVEVIEEEAFLSANTSYVTLPKSISYIGDKAFAYTHINSIYISDNVEYIGAEAFRSIDKILLSGSNIMDEWDKSWCDKSARIYFNSVGIERIEGVYYVLHNDMTATVADMPDYSHSKMELLEKVIFNEKNYFVTTIGTYAGADTTFEEITIPSSIIKIC